MLFIPDVAWEWYELYSYIEKYPHTAPTFWEQSPRYAEFKRYFLSKKSEYEEAMRQAGEVR